MGNKARNMSLQHVENSEFWGPLLKNTAKLTLGGRGKQWKAAEAQRGERQ